MKPVDLADISKRIADIAARFGIEATDGFARYYVAAEIVFCWGVIENARVGWRVRDDEPLRYVLKHLARGSPHEAAKFLAASQRGEIPFWRARALAALLDDVKFVLPSGHKVDFEFGLGIMQAYQRLSDEAAARLARKGAEKSGRPPDDELNDFIERLITMATAAGTDLSPPRHLVDGILTALAHAVKNIEGRLDELNPDARASVTDRLADYRAMSKGDVRTRIAEYRRERMARKTQQTRVA